MPPRTRGSPRRCCGTDAARETSIDASILAVVVLPFVAEITTEPSASRRAMRSMASGAIRSSSLPGSVVPPPARVRRESPAAARAAATLAGKAVTGRTLAMRRR